MMAIFEFYRDDDAQKIFTINFRSSLQFLITRDFKNFALKYLVYAKNMDNNKGRWFQGIYFTKKENTKPFRFFLLYFTHFFFFHFILKIEFIHILLHMTRHKCMKHEKLFSILLSNMHKKSTFPFKNVPFYTNNGSSEYNNKIVFLHTYTFAQNGSI